MTIWYSWIFQGRSTFTFLALCTRSLIFWNKPKTWTPDQSNCHVNICGLMQFSSVVRLSDVQTELLTARGLIKILLVKLVILLHLFVLQSFPGGSLVPSPTAALDIPHLQWIQSSQQCSACSHTALHPDTLCSLSGDKEYWNHELQQLPSSVSSSTAPPSTAPDIPPPQVQALTSVELQLISHFPSLKGSSLHTSSCNSLAPGPPHTSPREGAIAHSPGRGLEKKSPFPNPVTSVGPREISPGCWRSAQWLISIGVPQFHCLEEFLPFPSTHTNCQKLCLLCSRLPVEGASLQSRAQSSRQIITQHAASLTSKTWQSGNGWQDTAAAEPS